ncbi:MAG TPA: branched-chain amino acid ABC transporter permease, partial [Syntrophomonas sp.]|nr:branched-chain amino acid ABC transporter permease [Syntrophomonas sp.]
MDERKNIKTTLTLVSLVLLAGILYWGQNNLSTFQIRILNLAAIFVILGVSMNLVIGFTGMFSLGHSGFMCIGAYTAAILTMSPESKELIYFMEPIVPFLAHVEWPIFAAVIMAALISALFGFLIGFPALRLRDDYLAIATLGF